MNEQSRAAARRLWWRKAKIALALLLSFELMVIVAGSARDFKLHGNMCPTMCSVSLRNEWRVSRLLVCYDWIEMIKLCARTLESRKKDGSDQRATRKKFVIWKSSRLDCCRCQCRARKLIFTLNFPCDLLLLPLLARLLSCPVLYMCYNVNCVLIAAVAKEIITNFTVWCSPWKRERWDDNDLTLL